MIALGQIIAEANIVDIISISDGLRMKIEYIWWWLEIFKSKRSFIS